MPEQPEQAPAQLPTWYLFVVAAFGLLMCLVGYAIGLIQSLACGLIVVVLSAFLIVRRLTR